MGLLAVDCCGIVVHAAAVGDTLPAAVPENVAVVSADVPVVAAAAAVASIAVSTAQTGRPVAGAYSG